MRDKCPKCGAVPLAQLPAKYSPEDAYGKYRREAKKGQLKERGGYDFHRKAETYSVLLAYAHKTSVLPRTPE
jgi:H/ACA ribonucleoprotein complex subunit 3